MCRCRPQVRPYLIADGGNVEVAGIEDGVVALRLQVGRRPTGATFSHLRFSMFTLSSEQC